jgi:ATP-binding cassette subfamily B protein
MPRRRFLEAPDEKPQRPADPAVRKANLRRIVRLFGPYRRRLAAVCGLILVSASLGAVSPFLLREVLDSAIPENDTTLLTYLVAGMVAIAVVTGVLGVVQTLFSRSVTFASHSS